MIAAVAAVASAWPARPGVALTLTNVGPVAMQAVTVRVTGKAYAVGDLAPGASTALTIQPVSESDIHVDVAGAGRLQLDCYLEPAYKGKIAADVTRERVVSVKQDVVFSSY